MHRSRGFLAKRAGIVPDEPHQCGVEPFEISSDFIAVTSCTRHRCSIRHLTGSCGVGSLHRPQFTGEVAEYEVPGILGVQLTPARQRGYDAIEKAGGRIGRLQLKRTLSAPQPQTRSASGIHRHNEALGWLLSAFRKWGFPCLATRTPRVWTIALSAER